MRQKDKHDNLYVNIKKNNPNKNIFVTGCAAQINPNKFNMMKEVDLIIGNNQKIQEETWKNFKCFYQTRR